MQICKTCPRQSLCEYPCEQYQQQKPIGYKKFLEMLKNNNISNLNQFTLLPYQIEMLERIKNGRY